MKSDLEINQATKLKSINEIVKSLHIKADDLDFYGAYSAKLKASFTNGLKENKKSKLHVVEKMIEHSIKLNSKLFCVNMKQLQRSLIVSVYLYIYIIL